MKNYTYVFNVFFENPKNMTFYVFLSCCTRFLEHWSRMRCCDDHGDRRFEASYGETCVGASWLTQRATSGMAWRGSWSISLPTPNLPTSLSPSKPPPTGRPAQPGTSHSGSEWLGSLLWSPQWDDSVLTWQCGWWPSMLAVYNSKQCSRVLSVSTTRWLAR